MTRPFTKDTHVIPIETIAAGTLQTSDGRPVYAISNYTTAPTDGRPLREVTPTNPNNGSPIIACSLYAQGTLMTADGRPVYAVTGASPYGDSAYKLALDFDSASYWASGTNYAALSSFPGYTYTRTGIQGAPNAAGNAVTFFAANVPAITDAGYHAYAGLTNLATRSQEFTVAPWATVGNDGSATLTADAAVAPDGTTTADRLQISTTVGYRFLSNNQTAGTASKVLTLNVWMKSANGSPQTVGLAGVWNTRTSRTCAVTTTWQRFTLIRDATADAANQEIEIGVLNTLGVVTDANLDIYIWQAEMYDGNFPDGGPIIATAGATAAIGEGLMEESDAVGADADQLFIAKGAIRTAASGPHLAEWNDNSDANLLRISYDGGGSINAIIRAANVLVYNQGPVYTLGDEVTIVVRRLGGEWRVGKVQGGVLTWAASAVAAFPTAMTIVNPAAYQTTGYAPNDQVQFVGRKLGTFDTDAKVLAVAAEIA